MSAEAKNIGKRELPVQREKLDDLWQKAWALIVKEVENPTDVQIMFIKEGHLVEIQSFWDSDCLSGISIKSWALDSQPKVMIEPKIMQTEAEAFVYSPGMSTMPGLDLETWGFDGKVTPDWVEGITFSLAQLLGEI